MARNVTIGTARVATARVGKIAGETGVTGMSGVVRGVRGERMDSNVRGRRGGLGMISVAEKMRMAGVGAGHPAPVVAVMTSTVMTCVPVRAEAQDLVGTPEAMSVLGRGSTSALDQRPRTILSPR